jgi:hypothetical protein
MGLRIRHKLGDIGREADGGGAVNEEGERIGK